MVERRVELVGFSGLRVVDDALLELGLTLPGLKERADALTRLPSLGLLTLAGAAPPGWEVGYHEADGDDAALAEALIEAQPTLVALSALTAVVEDAYRFAARLRAAGVPVVLGGLHATTCTEEAAAHVDSVVVGEGEGVFAAVLEDAAAGALRPRYRGGEPVELGNAPVPRWDLVRRPRARYTVQTQRGCPFACEFCGASRLLGRFRAKPPACVGAELAALVARDPRAVVELADDNTFAREDAAALVEALAQSGVRYFTESDWRLGERPEVLEGLAASGCVQVLVGLESLVHETPGMMAKRASEARIAEALAAIQEAGVAVIGCYVAGADGETEASLARLTEVALASPLADVQVTLQTPFPGTGLRSRLERAGRLLDVGWSHHTLLDVTYRPDGMSVDALREGFREVVREVWSPAAAGRRAKIRRAVWRRRGDDSAVGEGVDR